MARKKCSLRDLEPALLRAHAELLVMLRTWEALHPRSKLRWEIEKQMARTAFFAMDAFRFPRLRSRAARHLHVLASELTELWESSGAVSWSKMPDLACNQRWEYSTPLGATSITIGTPAVDAEEQAGFSIFICNAAAATSSEFMSAASLCRTFRSNNARLVAGPSSPWFAPPSR